MCGKTLATSASRSLHVSVGARVAVASAIMRWRMFVTVLDPWTKSAHWSAMTYARFASAGFLSRGRIHDNAEASIMTSDAAVAAICVFDARVCVGEEGGGGCGVDMTRRFGKGEGNDTTGKGGGAEALRAGSES